MRLSCNGTEKELIKEEMPQKGTIFCGNQKSAFQLHEGRFRKSEGKGSRFSASPG
jgi:hypothetical protein